MTQTVRRCRWARLHPGLDDCLCRTLEAVAEELMGIPMTIRSVLIVDDNQDLAENIAEILSMRGFATEIATSAEEALPKALPDGPGIVVSDFRLPGMSGADLIREIRRARSTV